MRLPTYCTLIAAALAVPGPMTAAGYAHLWPLHESKKLVRANRVDRVSVNADLIWFDWLTGLFSAPASLAPALTSGDTRTSPRTFSLPAPEPVAVIASCRVVVNRPAADLRFPGRRGLLN
jgi:hypothetical protein